MFDIHLQPELTTARLHSYSYRNEHQLEETFAQLIKQAPAGSTGVPIPALPEWRHGGHLFIRESRAGQTVFRIDLPA